MHVIKRGASHMVLVAGSLFGSSQEWPYSTIWAWWLFINLRLLLFRIYAAIIFFFFFFFFFFFIVTIIFAVVVIMVICLRLSPPFFFHSCASATTFLASSFCAASQGWITKDKPRPAWLLWKIQILGGAVEPCGTIINYGKPPFFYG